MSISFGAATGNLFNRLGALGELLRELRVYHNSIYTDLTSTSVGVVAEYNAEPDIQAIAGNGYLGALSSAESVASLVQGIAEQTVNRMVFRDNPRIGQTLTSTNTVDSLKEIIRQMKIAGATIQSQTVAATVSTFTGTGNGVINVSTRRSDGLTQENSYAETLLVTCNSDSYLGGATAGNEGFSITGTGKQSDTFAFNWPLGSDATAGVSAIDADTDNGSGNLLTNSGFSTFTVANTPDNFTLVAGTAGTDLFSESTLVYDNGGKALRILGNGSDGQVNITQTFDVSTGTNGILEASGQYSFNLMMRRDGTAVGAGVLTVDLIDGSNNVIQDTQGTNNSFTCDLTTLTTSYASFKGVFRMPATVPTTYKLRLRLTTGLSNGRSIYLDKMSLGEMVQLYTGGPSAAVHAGSTPFVSGDYGTITVTNNRGGATNLASFGPLLERFFRLSELDLLFPSASSPSISDSLIQ